MVASKQHKVDNQPLAFIIIINIALDKRTLQNVTQNSKVRALSEKNQLWTSASSSVSQKSLD